MKLIMLSRFMSYVLTCMLLLISLLSPSQVFEEVTTEVGIDCGFASMSLMGGGMTWFDYNNDGTEDLYITGGNNKDELYKNNGDGTFTEIPGFIETDLPNTMGVVAGDIDNDGFRDLFVTTWNSGLSPLWQPNLLYYNNGDGTFTEISESAGLTEAKFALSACFLDANLDGLLDIYVGNYVGESVIIYDDQNNPIGFDHNCLLDDLYLNNGDLTFTNATEAIGVQNIGCTLAVSATDFDRDMDTDIMVANDFGEWVEPNHLYENLEGDSLEEIGAQTQANVGIYGMGIAIGDYDEDQDMDYYVTNIGRNVLLRQNNGVFQDATEQAGVEDEYYQEEFLVGWGTFFFDYDNDTYLDLFVANGYIDAVSWLSNYEYQPNRLYRNTGQGTFDEITQDVFPGNYKISRGCAYGDYNKDGLLDVAVANIHNFFEPNDDVFYLYENQGEPLPSAQFKLEGMACNKDAIGAQVELFAGQRSFIREVDGGSSHCSQNSSVLHFGLGEIEEVDSAIVSWPGGDYQAVYDIMIGKVNYIIQDTTTLIIEPPDTSVTDTTTTDTLVTHLQGWFERYGLRLYPNPIRNQFTLEYVLAQPEQIQLSLRDLQGRVVWKVANLSRQQGFHRLNMNIPVHIASGTYLCEIQTQLGLITRKIQVRRE